jgi:alpha-L-fucosidase 2
MVGQHDLIYRTPPRIWTDGFPAGNGHFGGMVWQPEGPDRICIGITKLDVWDYRCKHYDLAPFDRFRHLLKTDPKLAVAKIYAEPGYDAPYPSPKLCGKLTIGVDEGFLPLSATIHSQSQRLRLYDATVECEYEISTRAVVAEAFVSAHENVLAAQISNTWVHDRFKSADRQLISLEREIDETLGIPEFGATKGVLYVRYAFPDGFEYVMAASVDGLPMAEPLVQPERVSTSVELGDLELGPVYTVYLTVVTSMDAADPLAKAKENLNRAVDAGFSKLKDAHKEWWHDFWRASGVEIDDRFLEGLWYFSLYQLASTCRGPIAPGLFGLWNMSKTPPWHGDYHGDYNIAMAHWYLFSSNHLELGEPYFNTFLSMLPTVKKQTMDLYQIDGAKYPVATAPIMGLEITHTYYRMMQVTSAYYAIAFWWRYLYSKDEEFLRNIAFPVLEESSKFYAALVERTEDGLTIGPSWAPEQGKLPAYNVTNDLSLIKLTWTAYVESCRVLGLGTETLSRIVEYLDAYPDYSRTHDRFLDSRGAPVDLLMAHTGLFSMVYPAGEVDADHPLAAVAETTIDTYHERAQRKSFVGRSSLSDVQAWTTQALGMARLRKPERLDHYLVDVGLSEYLKPNGMITIISNGIFETREAKRNAYDIGPEPRAQHVLVAAANTRRGRDRHFQFLEGPSALVCILNEMMLQSHGGIIRVFPSVPKRIKDCSFSSLRAEGAFLVSARRRDGRTERVEVRSLTGGRCTVRIFGLGDTSRVDIAGGGGKVVETEGDTWSFDTQEGDEYTLTVDSHAEPVELSPFRDHADVDHFVDCWGQKIFYGKPDAPEWP